VLGDQKNRFDPVTPIVAEDGLPLCG
jgi:hypothetical protein